MQLIYNTSFNRYLETQLGDSIHFSNVIPLLSFGQFSLLSTENLLDQKLRVCFDIERNRSIQIRAPKSWDWMIDRKAMGRLKSEIL